MTVDKIDFIFSFILQCKKLNRGQCINSIELQHGHELEFYVIPYICFRCMRSVIHV